MTEQIKRHAMPGLSKVIGKRCEIIDIAVSPEPTSESNHFARAQEKVKGWLTEGSALYREMFDPLDR